MLVNHFKLEELVVLSFDAGMDYKDLEGETKNTKMQDLVLKLFNRGTLQCLIDEARKQRPMYEWPDVKDVELFDQFDTVDSYVDQKTGLTMIRIPAGDFLYGEDNEELGTKLRIEYLPQYWISKTPVTNRLYRRFIREEKYVAPVHWEKILPSARIAEHPVTNVSWKDANAYAKWAKMELPTEQEWEKAARGEKGLRYPWGDNWLNGHCNTAELWGNEVWNAGTTTEVGRFSPIGDSPYGCVDMSGNMWEWSISWIDDGIRVLRGGVWYLTKTAARVANRFIRFDDPQAEANEGDSTIRLVVRSTLK